MKILAPLLLFLLAGCGVQSASDEAGTGEETTGEAATDEDVAAEQKDIEDAADEAAKVVEADAEEEVEAAKGEAEE